MYDSFDNTYQVRLNTSTFNFNNHWWCLISTAILIGNDCEYLVDSFFSGHNRNWFPVENYVSWRQNSKFIFGTTSTSVFVLLLLVQLLFFSHWIMLFLTHTETAFVRCYCDQECCIPLDNPSFLCSYLPQHEFSSSPSYPFIYFLITVLKLNTLLDPVRRADDKWRVITSFFPPKGPGS